MLATGLIVAYGYGMEAFMGWYSGNQFDSFLLWNRLHGPYRVLVSGVARAATFSSRKCCG